MTNGFELDNLNIHGYYDIYTFFSGRPDKTNESYKFDWSGKESNIHGKNSMIIPFECVCCTITEPHFGRYLLWKCQVSFLGRCSLED